MSNFKPTKEQERIFTFIKKRSENILIEAYAGAGKTSTIVKASELLPKDKNILFLAFNKHIQTELKEKLPDYIRCYTSHGLGLAAIKRKYGDKIQMDEFKLDKIIKKISSRWNLKKELKNQEEIYYYLSNIKKLVNLAKLSLTLDAKYMPYLIEKHSIDLNGSRDIKRVLKVLDMSQQDVSTFDFADMIFMPAIDKSIWLFPQDYVIVDEAQDLNRCQIRLIEKMLKKNRSTKKYEGRLIAVGDKFQSIYGFASSDQNAFEWFRKFPKTKTLPLSYSFRCSKAVVKEANKIVPDIKPLETAPKGSVINGSAINDARDGDFILCRTTKPLVTLFFSLLVQRKKAVIKGSDIGRDLNNMIGNIKTISELHTFWNEEIKKFKINLKNNGILNPVEHSSYISFKDKIDTLFFIADFVNNITELKETIDTIFTDELKGIILSTIHKAKGLESDRVFIIRPDLLPLPQCRKGWEFVQEKNLEYVAITRAKKDLIYDVSWSDEEPNEENNNNNGINVDVD